MKLRKAYNFRLRTNAEIEALMFQFAGCNRKVWNMGLALQKNALEETHKILSYNLLAGYLPQWKKDDDTAFLNIAPSQTLQQTLKALDRALREKKLLARKVKFSNNWKKQKQVVSKIHIKIANARNDFLQKTSTIASKNHAVIVAEKLKINNMSSSAKVNIENPGKNVTAKSGLNKAILDQGWGNFLRMINYKQEWSGGELIQINPKNTSRTCLSCGYISADNRKSQAVFCCQQCGYSANADYVGAVNIKNRGIEKLKEAAGHCRDSLWRKSISSPVKQEPVGKSNQLPLLSPA